MITLKQWINFNKIGFMYETTAEINQISSAFSQHLEIELHFGFKKSFSRSFDQIDCSNTFESVTSDNEISQSKKMLGGWQKIYNIK